MTGRATGATLQQPPRYGWMRVMTFMLAFTLLSMPGLGIAHLFGPGSLAEGIQMTLVASPFGYAGGVLLWRLLRGR